MRVLLDLVTVIAVSAGALFFLAGTVGLLRFPDSLSRLHALTKADNLGLGLIVLGLLPQAREPFCGAEAGRGLAAGPVGRGDGHPACCSRNPTRRSAGMIAAHGARCGIGLAGAGRGRLDRGAGPTFAAVVGFVAYGLLLALVWVRLAAVDVALTEAAVGSGVTGALLICRGRTAFAPQSNERQRNSPAPRCVLRPLCSPFLSRPDSLHLCSSRPNRLPPWHPRRRRIFT